MAWVELLPSFGVDGEVAGEMDKDVKRLAAVASRFSKIGSRPALEPAPICEVTERIVSYMATRISSQVDLTMLCDARHDLMVAMSQPLIEWVMENLIKMLWMQWTVMDPSPSLCRKLPQASATSLM